MRTQRRALRRQELPRAVIVAAFGLFALLASCSDTSMSSGDKAGKTDEKAADANAAPAGEVDAQQANAAAPAATTQDAKTVGAPGSDAELNARAQNTREEVQNDNAPALSCDKVTQPAGGWGATGASAIELATCKNVPTTLGAVQYVFCRADGADLSACAPYVKDAAFAALSDEAKQKFAAELGAINAADHAGCLRLAQSVNEAKVQDDAVACLRIQNL
jgi:hypothetical protein